LKEVIPHATRLAILLNPADPESARQFAELESVARSLGLRAQRVEARGPEDFAGAFAAMAREGAEGLLVAGGSTFLVHRARLAELAIRAKLPTMWSFRKASRRVE
jgi:putative ABC transport system substrate-binding protein